MHTPNAFLLKAYHLGFLTASNPDMAKVFRADCENLPESAERPYAESMENLLHYRGMWPSEVCAFTAGYFEGDPGTARPESDPECKPAWLRLIPA